MLHTCLLFEKRNHSGGLSLHSLNSGTERASCPTNYAWSVASWFCINHVIKLISSCSFSPCTAGLPVLPWATMFPLLTLWLLTTLATSLMFFTLTRYCTSLPSSLYIYIPALARYIEPIHPYRRGKHIVAFYAIDQCHASSPQARGTLYQPHALNVTVRFISTGAGNMVAWSVLHRWWVASFAALNLASKAA